MVVAIRHLCGRMRSILLQGLLCLAAFPVFAQPQSSPDCVVAAHYPPFMILGDPRKEGISIDIIRAAAARAGRTIEIRFMPFQRALFTLKTDPGCIIPALFRNASRERDYRWIATYHAAELSFMTVSKQINTLEDGRKLNRVAVETYASADQFLTGLGFDNLVHIASPTSSAQMLQAGRIDAWVQSPRAAQHLWDQLELRTKLHVGAPMYSVPIYVTAGLGYPDELTFAYQNAITAMISDGTVEQILKQYD